MTSTFARCLRLFLLPLVALSLAGCAGGGAQTPTSSGYTDAMEIKLKCREMADQMLATMPNTALEGFVAMPTSFVNKNNTSQSSPLGRLLAESMYYEFNQRGFPTREYRLSGARMILRWPPASSPPSRARSGPRCSWARIWWTRTQPSSTPGSYGPATASCCVRPSLCSSIRPSSIVCFPTAPATRKATP